MSALVLYPLIGIAIVLFGAIVIRINFHKDVTLIQHDTSYQGLTATYSWRRPILLTIILLAITAWIIWQVWSIAQIHTPALKPFYIFFGALALSQLFISIISRPYRIRSSTETNDLFKTAIIMPVYNESEYSLRQGLESFFKQTRLPNQIHIVDDGSTGHYQKTQEWLKQQGQEHGVEISWIKATVNAGKRHAHSTAYEAITPDDNMIVVTIDSDGLIDPHAIEEGLKPFHDPEVMSVAGVVVAKNVQTNLLSRMLDLLFVSNQQLIDRSTMSQFGSVLVNSGGLAFYRYEVIQAAIDYGYTEEVFFGRPVVFSDDSYLTLFALVHGKTVQQPSAIVFCDMPVKFGHHIRQQLRWGRGSFIRSWWRLRHLPVNSFAYLRQLVGWCVFVALTTILVEIFIFLPITTGTLPSLQLFIIPIIFSHLQAARYFAIKRSDMSRRSQVAIFALAPLAMLWSTVVLRAVRLYASATCFKTGWGTRTSIEILHPSDTPA